MKHAQFILRGMWQMRPLSLRCRLDFHAYTLRDEFGRVFCARPGCEKRKPIRYASMPIPELQAHTLVRPKTKTNKPPPPPAHKQKPFVRAKTNHSQTRRSK